MNLSKKDILYDKLLFFKSGQAMSLAHLICWLVIGLILLSMILTSQYGFNFNCRHLTSKKESKQELWAKSLKVQLIVQVLFVVKLGSRSKVYLKSLRDLDLELDSIIAMPPTTTHPENFFEQNKIERRVIDQQYFMKSKPLQRLMQNIAFCVTYCILECSIGQPFVKETTILGGTKFYPIYTEFSWWITNQPPIPHPLLSAYQNRNFHAHQPSGTACQSAIMHPTQQSVHQYCSNKFLGTVIQYLGLVAVCRAKPCRLP